MPAGENDNRNACKPEATRSIRVYKAGFRTPGILQNTLGFDGAFFVLVLIVDLGFVSLKPCHIGISYQLTAASCQPFFNNSLSSSFPRLT